MRAKIVEANCQGLWLKVIVARLDETDWQRPSALPNLPDEYRDRSLLQLLGKPQPDDIWILDLSTMEGAAFSSRSGIPELDIAKREARL